MITAVNLVSFAKSRKKHLAGEDEDPAENDAGREAEDKSVDADYDDDEEDGFEKFAKNFYKAPVPGENKSDSKKP